MDDEPIERSRLDPLSLSAPSDLTDMAAAASLSQLRAELVQCERSIRMNRRETLCSREACAELERIRGVQSSRSRLAASQQSSSSPAPQPGFRLRKEGDGVRSPSTAERFTVIIDRSPPRRLRRRSPAGKDVLAFHRFWEDRLQHEMLCLDRRPATGEGRYPRRTHYLPLLPWLGEECVEVGETHLTLRVVRT